MTNTRVFVAVDISEAVRQRAGDLIQRLRASDARVTWVKPENMHVTLKFLGEQTDESMATICRVVMAAARDVSPFDFECHGAGAFPNCRRPRTVWLGVREGTSSLQQLHRHIEKKLIEQGYKKERRGFHPHLTLGRVREGGRAAEELGDLVSKAQDFQAGVVHAEEVVVLGSHLQRSGARYEVLARAPFGGRQAPDAVADT